MDIFKIPLRNANHDVIDHALVDEDDFEKVNEYVWYKEIVATRKDGSSLQYARGTSLVQKQFMHQFVMGKAPAGQSIDHINQNGLDNRKSINLRYATQSQNSQNVKKREGTTSIYKGVTDEAGKWRAKIAENHLGRFTDEKDAGRAYDIAAFQLFGVYASHNDLLTLEEKRQALITPFVESKTAHAKGVEPTSSGKFTARIKTEEFGREGLGTFPTEQEAKKAYVTRLAEALKIRQEKHASSPIERSSEGQAIIKIKNHKKEITHHLTVPDQDWHWMSSMSWYLHKGKPVTQLGRSLGRKQVSIEKMMEEKGLVWTGSVICVQD